MFSASALILDGDEKVALEVNQFGTRVVIRDGQQTLSIDIRDAAVAHQLAEAFGGAMEALAAREEQRLREWIAA